MPVTAECTINTRAPPSTRLRVTWAMLRQLASDETLVPPNFRTIHAEGVRVTDSLPRARLPAAAAAEAVASYVDLRLSWTSS
jgi:hypothetical protein